MKSSDETSGKAVEGRQTTVNWNHLELHCSYSCRLHKIPTHYESNCSSTEPRRLSADAGHRRKMQCCLPDSMPVSHMPKPFLNKCYTQYIANILTTTPNVLFQQNSHKRIRVYLLLDGEWA